MLITPPLHNVSSNLLLTMLHLTISAPLSSRLVIRQIWPKPSILQRKFWIWRSTGRSYAQNVFNGGTERFLARPGSFALIAQLLITRPLNALYLVTLNQRVELYHPDLGIISLMKDFLPLLTRPVIVPSLPNPPLVAMDVAFTDTWRRLVSKEKGRRDGNGFLNPKLPTLPLTLHLPPRLPKRFLLLLSQQHSSRHLPRALPPW